MKLKQPALFLALFVVAGQATARKFDARLASVRTVFVAGNSPAASNARKLISRWTCFRQAPNPQKANAVFQFSQQMSHAQSSFARRGKRAMVIATLTTKNGHLLWSKPVSHHADFMNTGGGAAARKAIFALQNDAFPYARMTFGGVDRRSCPNRPPARATRRHRKRAWPY